LNQNEILPKANKEDYQMGKIEKTAQTLQSNGIFDCGKHEAMQIGAFKNLGSIPGQL